MAKASSEIVAAVSLTSTALYVSALAFRRGTVTDYTAGIINRANNTQINVGQTKGQPLLSVVDVLGVKTNRAEWAWEKDGWVVRMVATLPVGKTKGIGHLSVSGRDAAGLPLLYDATALVTFGEKIV